MDLSYTFTNSGDCKIIYLKETEIRKRNKTFVMGLMYLEGKALLIACHLIIIEIQHKEMMMMMIIIHFSFMMWVKGWGGGLNDPRRGSFPHHPRLQPNRFPRLISQLLLSCSSKIIIYCKGVYYYVAQRKDYKIRWSSCNSGIKWNKIRNSFGFFFDTRKRSPATISFPPFFVPTYLLTYMD